MIVTVVSLILSTEVENVFNGNIFSLQEQTIENCLGRLFCSSSELFELYFWQIKLQIT